MPSIDRDPKSVNDEFNDPQNEDPDPSEAQDEDPVNIQNIQHDDIEHLSPDQRHFVETLQHMYALNAQMRENRENNTQDEDPENNPDDTEDPQPISPRM